MPDTGCGPVPVEMKVRLLSRSTHDVQDRATRFSRVPYVFLSERDDLQVSNVIKFSEVALVGTLDAVVVELTLRDLTLEGFKKRCLVGA